MKHLHLLSLLLLCNQPKTLRVMAFNIFRGGERGYAAIVQAAKAAEADVIVIQESFSTSQQLANELGWSYVSTGTAGSADIISRLPLTTHVGYVMVEGVAIVNVKLPASNYGPYSTTTQQEPTIVAQEKLTRIPALIGLLNPVKGLSRVIVAGDFNAPSHLDWTSDTVGMRPQMAYPVSWPTSVLMHQSGFVDTFRDINPNPRLHPGLTWWAAFQNTTEPRDRIDFIFSKGLEVLDSQLLGADDVSPWSSDHNAVIATFAIP
jgi:endonuclease/exonuclease/phosphatase family metal-dependent hydrolase